MVISRYNYIQNHRQYIFQYHNNNILYIAYNVQQDSKEKTITNQIAYYTKLTVAKEVSCLIKKVLQKKINSGFISAVFVYGVIK